MHTQLHTPVHYKLDWLAFGPLVIHGVAVCACKTRCMCLLGWKLQVSHLYRHHYTTGPQYCHINTHMSSFLLMFPSAVECTSPFSKCVFPAVCCTSALSMTLPVDSSRQPIIMSASQAILYKNGLKNGLSNLYAPVSLLQVPSKFLTFCQKRN